MAEYAGGCCLRVLSMRLEADVFNQIISTRLDNTRHPCQLSPGMRILRKGKRKCTVDEWHACETRDLG